MENIDRVIKKHKDFLIINMFDNVINKNLFYLTGYRGLGILHNKALYVPSMELERAKKEITVKVRIKTFKNLKAIMDNTKSEEIGLEFDNLPAKVFRKIRKKKIPIDDSISELRMKKSDDEIIKIKKACSISDKILNHIEINLIKKKLKSEMEIFKFIEEKARENNVKTSFTSIVACGKNTSMAHHAKNNQKLQKGFLMIDMGIKYKGYCSDTTRMFYLGTPSEDEIQAYKNVLSVQKKCTAMAENGRTFKELQDFACERLGKRFNHALGHGVGLQVHEKPHFDNTKIEEGMVFTIEPGIYLEGKYGIRIEDTVVIKNGKAKILTKFPKELFVVKEFH